MADQPPLEAVRLLSAFRGYQLVVAACRLKLPDLVAAGRGDPKDLAATTRTHEPSLRRVLRGLAAWGFFIEDHGLYAATPISDAFRSDKPGLRNMAIMLSHEGYQVWGDLMYTLETGNPAFEHTFGMSRWQRMAADPDDAAHFNAAMVEGTQRIAGAFVPSYDFTGVHTVVDVGGGNGALLIAILLQHRDLVGIVFDQAAGLVGAAERFGASGLEERVTFVEGSFFESVPRTGDLYLLKSIIHDWDDEHATAILKTCRGAMSPTARLVLLERFLPERIEMPAESFGTVMSDVHMMVALGGRERTTAEYSALLEAAGLEMTRSIANGSDFYAIEAAPV